jgi:hypothetical protein
MLLYSSQYDKEMSQQHHCMLLLISFQIQFNRILSVQNRASFSNGLFLLSYTCTEQSDQAHINLYNNAISLLHMFFIQCIMVVTA